MATILLKIELADIQRFIAERDALRDRVAELEATPLDFSLEKLAGDVLRNYGHGFTPGQEKQIGNAIRSAGRPRVKGE